MLRVIAHTEDSKFRDRFENDFRSYCIVPPAQRKERITVLLYGKNTWRDTSFERTLSGRVIVVFLPSFPVTKDGLPDRLYVHKRLREPIEGGTYTAYFWPPRARRDLITIDVAIREVEPKVTYLGTIFRYFGIWKRE